jgi:cell division protein FtsI (penicillin-binding protein 3)
MSPAVANEKRLAVIVAVLGLWTLACAGRLVQVMVVRGDELRAKAAKQQERKLTFQLKRGEILDAAGRELAVSVEAASVFAVPGEIESPVETAKLLSPVVGVKSLTLIDRFREEKDFVWIARKIDRATAEKVRALGLAGIHLLPDSRRIRPKGALASQLLGWVGLDNDGRAGLEYEYDREIAGRPGVLTVLRDARTRAGGNVWKEVVRQEPVGGRSLHLTIDSSIQYVAERELAAGAARYHATGGSVVVMDPRDGAILALASWPPFDPDGPRNPDSADWRLRPIMDAYEPGSTFKLVAATAALGSGALKEGDPIDCGNGEITIAGATIHEHESRSFGVISFCDALAYSSNVGFVRVGILVGRDAFYRQMTSLGFGHPTGIDLPGENGGILQEPKGWSALSLAAMSMGQEIAITPIQLATAYAAVANGGFLVRPFVVREVVAGDGTVVRQGGAPPHRRVLAEEVARRFRGMLEGVVARGTGKEAAVDGYRVAGKTGTAQKPVRGGYARDRFVASFAGMVPADSPRFVMAVVVDEPHGSIYGGTVAAPIFREIAASTLEYLRVPPTENREKRVLEARLDRIPAEPPMLEPADHLARTGLPAGGTELSRSTRTVPDVTGLDLRRAVALLAGEGMVPEVVGRGWVRSQDPPAGRPVRMGETCVIVLEPKRQTGAEEL